MHYLNEAVNYAQKHLTFDVPSCEYRLRQSQNDPLLNDEEARLFERIVVETIANVNNPT